MGSTAFSLGLDIVILIALGVTIYFALRLSKALNNFRNQRSEFNKLIRDLSKNIEAAQNSIDGLKQAGQSSGAELQRIISESKGLADELKLMNEAGNSLAKRLEKLAERNRRVAQGYEGRKADKFDADDFDDDFIDEEEDNAFLSENVASMDNYTTGKNGAGKDKPGLDRGDPPPSFFIRDPEFDNDFDDDMAADDDSDEDVYDDDYESDDDVAAFQSQAEKDLYNALKDNRKRKN